MFFAKNSHLDGKASLNTNVARVWSLVIGATSEGPRRLQAADCVALTLWRALDELVVVSKGERISSDATSRGADIVLASIHVRFNPDNIVLDRPCAAPVLRPLGTQYKAVAHQLQRLMIEWSDYDEGADETGDLAAFAAVAKNLRELSFLSCGQVSSVRGLRFLHQRHKNDLSSPSLRRVDFSSCLQLTSLDGLQYHQQLEEITASNTAIASLNALMLQKEVTVVDGFPLLTTLRLQHCDQLDALLPLPQNTACGQLLSPPHFASLKELDLCASGITSVQGLLRRVCPTLEKLDLRNCHHLQTLDNLLDDLTEIEEEVRHQAVIPSPPASTKLKEICVSGSSITSLTALLLGFPLLEKVDVSGCDALNTLAGLQGIEHAGRLVEVNASNTAIISLRELALLQTFATHEPTQHSEGEWAENKHRLQPEAPPSALTRLDASMCGRLASLDGVQGHRLLAVIDVSRTAITSLCELLTCPALQRVHAHNCRKLRSLNGLQRHAHLTHVDAAATAIISVKELVDGCTALRTVILCGCRRQLSALEDLRGVEIVR